MSKHLSLSDRAIIEKGIAQGCSFAYIARQLHRDPSTITREVRYHRAFVFDERFDINSCLEFHRCLRRNLCETETRYSCLGKCKNCTEYDCTQICPSFQSVNCDLLSRAPYVCTRCPEEKTCRRNHAYYTAHRAHAEYARLLRDSRRGLRTPPEKLLELNDLIAPLIAKGQSINHIFSTHGDQIGLSERTIYNYIDARAFDIRNIDLPRKVKYRQRHPQKILTKLEYKCRKGRTINDFNSYLEANPHLSVIEMDTVKGARGSGQVLLTFIFRETSFMLIFLLKDGTQESVTSVFDNLTALVGLDTFRKLFPVILTDNGVEFKGPHKLEFTENGARRTRIFYCDPQASWQKPHVENNHTLIRRILPKGTSFQFLTSEDIHLMTCHINSVARELFANNTPFSMMKEEKYKKLLEALALSPIPPDEVCLRPALLKRNH